MLPSGHYASMCAIVLGGTHPDTGRPYAFVEPELGGWGGSHDSDGTTAMFSGFHGVTFNCPAEINEARNGLQVDRLELNPDPGGEGRHRGGKGIRMDYRIRTEEGFATCFFTRSKFPPWGLAGGNDGSPNYIEVIRKDGTLERQSAVTGLRLNRDDVVRIVTGNGGGYGDPRERPRDRIADDLKKWLPNPGACTRGLRLPTGLTMNEKGSGCDVSISWDAHSCVPLTASYRLESLHRHRNAGFRLRFD